jgi:hypothetical protein
MIPPRQLRSRLLDALEREVKQFRTREGLHPLRVPSDPILFDDVVAKALGDDGWLEPRTVRSRTVLRLEWDDGSGWELWVIVLPSGVKLFCDSGEDESRILASGGRNLGVATDRLFLELLSASAGEAFGIEMSGMAAAPARVRSSIDDRAFLVDVFVNLFEETAIEDSIRAAWGTKPDLDTTIGRDFRGEIERWLDAVLDPS